MWLVLAVSPAPARPAWALRPSFPSSATKFLPYSGPSRVTVWPDMLLPCASGVASWTWGSAQHDLLRLLCVSYWEDSPEASWSWGQVVTLTTSGCRGWHEIEFKSQTGLHFGSLPSVPPPTLTLPCCVLPSEPGRKFRAACALPSHRQGLWSLAWWTLALWLVRF